MKKYPVVQWGFRPARFWDNLLHWSEAVAAAAWSRLYGWLKPRNPERSMFRQARPEFEMLEKRYALSTVSFSASTYSVNSSTSTNTAPINVQVDVDPPMGTTVTAHYATSNGTAYAGNQYTATSGTVTFTYGGSTTQSFNVPIASTTSTQLNTTVDLTLSMVTGGGYSLGTPSTAVLTIQNQNYFLPSNGSPQAITDGPDGKLWFVDSYGATSDIGNITTSGTITQYTIPTGSVGDQQLVVGADHNLWFSENNSSKIGFSTTAGSVTDFSATYGGSPLYPYALIPGPNGQIWFPSGSMYEINSSGTITQLHSLSLPGILSMVLGPDGNLWFTGGYTGSSNLVGYINPSTWAVSTVSSGGGTAAQSLIVGPDGNLWFTDPVANEIGRVVPSTMTVTLFSSGLTSGAKPIGLSVGPGNTMWFGEEDVNQLGSITTAGVITEYTVPDSYGGGTGPFDTVFGPGGYLWLSNPYEYRIDNFSNMVSPAQSGNAPQLANTAATVASVAGGGPGNGLYNFSVGAISLATGGSYLSIPLDWSKSVPDCGCSGVTDVAADVEDADPETLDYYSASVSQQPIIQVTFQSDPGNSVPTQLQAQLTWNNGTPQTAVTFATTGHSAGDDYQMALEVSSAVTTTGYYPWSVDVTATYAGGETFSQTVSGNLAVVANDSNPVGAGWSLGSLDKIVSVTGGVLYVYGSGGASFFQSLGSGAFQSPPNDLGTLTENTTSGTYAYDAEGGLTYNFNNSGLLTSITDLNGLTRTYTYSGSQLSTIEEPDGGIGTFSYSSGLVSSIAGPSGTVTLTHSSSNLTVLQNVDSSLRTFTYDGNHHLTQDQWGGITTTYAYNATTGAVGTVQLDASTNLLVSPADAQALAATAPNASAVVGVITDGNSHATSYTLDQNGLPTKVVTADSAVWSYSRDFAEQITQATGPLGAVTQYQYSYGASDGDLQQVTMPDGSYATFTYNSYHEITGERDTQNNLTTNLYDAHGNLTSTSDTPGQATTYSWSGGRVQTMTDPFGNVTTYTYDSSLRVSTMTAPGGGVYTYTYDAAGNQQTVTDPLNHTSTTLYDALRRVTETIDALGNVATMAYNSLGLITGSTDADGNKTTYSYDDQGRLSATTQAAGTSLAATTTDLYDAAGNLTGVVDPRGYLTTYSYNAVNEQTGSTDPLSYHTTTLYDQAGNVTESVDANGNATQYLYDAAGQQTVVIDALGHRTTTVYDSQGNVKQVTDPNNNITTFLYDSNDRLTVTIDATGHRVTSLYDSAGNVTEVIDAVGTVTEITTYLYDSNERLTETIDPLGKITTNTYYANGLLCETIDPDNHITTYLYDSAGRQTVVIQGGSANIRTTALYDADGHLTGQLDQRGDLTQYLYDADGRQTVAVDGVGNRTTSLFDGNGNVTEVIDGRGNTTQYEYDALGRQTVVIDALSNRTTTLYDANGNVTEVLDANNHATKYLYDADNRQSVVIDALSHRTTSLFDGNGNVTQVTDPLGHVTKYQYDALNRLTVTIDALSHRATSLYDAAGNLTGQTDYNGALTHYQYDALNRLTVTIDGDGGHTTNLYDGFGNLTGVQDTDNHLTTYLYDLDNRLTATQYYDSRSLTMLYDAAGNVTSETDIYSRTTTYAYDYDNRVTLSVDALGLHTSLYDAAGNLTGSYDYNGNLLQYKFDADNRMTVSIDGGISGSNITTTMYDQVGNITSVDVAGDTTKYLYDADNRLTETIDPLNNTTTNLYDHVGNLTSTTDSDHNTTSFVYDADNELVDQYNPNGHHGNYVSFQYTADGLLSGTEDQLGRQTEYQYDADGRVTGQTWIATGGTIIDQRLTFTYDNDGNQSTAVNGNGTYSMTYNALGQVTGVQEPFSQRLTFSYDAQGNRTVVQDSLGGTTTSVYDDDNQLVEQELGGSGTTPLLVTLAYDQDGRNSSITRYNSLGGLATEVVATTSNSYDVYDRITNIQHENGSSSNIANYTYTYNAQGEVATATRNGVTITYTYDAAGELTGDGTATETYDAEGNRTNTGYTTGTDNELSSDGTWNYSYDADGNLVGKSQVTGSMAGTYSWTYVYDEKNEMLSAQEWLTTSGGMALQEQVTYTYDALGNRLETDTNTTGGIGTTTVQRYALDGWNPAKAGATGNANWDVWADLTSSNTLESRYLRGDVVDQLFARVDKSGSTYTAYWLLTDDLGSVEDVVNNTSSATEQATISYTSFGAPTISGTNQAAAGRYLWTGREYDSVTLLQYNRARWYDSSTGRWNSQDPMGFEAGDSNLYRYANNDPTSATDPSGLQNRPPTEQIVLATSNEKDAPTFTFSVSKQYGIINTPIEIGKEVKGKIIANYVVTRKNLKNDESNGVLLRFIPDNKNGKAVRFIQIFYVTASGDRQFASIDPATNKLVLGNSEDVTRFLPQFKHTVPFSIYETVATSIKNTGDLFFLDLFAGAKEPFYDSPGKRIDPVAGLDGQVSWMWDSPSFLSHMAEEQGISYLKTSFFYQKAYSGTIRFVGHFYTFAIVNGRAVYQFSWTAFAEAHKCGNSYSYSDTYVGVSKVPKATTQVSYDYYYKNLSTLVRFYFGKNQNFLTGAGPP